ncbi:ATP-binding protein [Thalassotalea sp. G2M2-11]|uniref:sensor histidine kinase n=1 Tax=Thalassotalea sp. G2M2-11 TaxID=2787627 RepID=UPI0019D1C7A2|nr:ATP-binding protein [Thalassotalea sp. G2M2-11]
MNWLKSRSLESFLTAKLIILSLPAVILLALTGHYAQLHWQWIIVAEFVLLLFIAWSIAAIKYRVLRSYTRAGLHLDAIKQEDYNQFAKASFPQGKVKDFHQQLNQLSDHLLAQKARYDQHVYLVYQLIGQLNSPVIVFNTKSQLTFANDAFGQLYQQPWQTFRHASAQSLGLEFDGQHWQFSQTTKTKWQIKHSTFIENGDHHQLLVFIDIEPALRANQLKAWQQIIRVLGHEIRNSLTPVSSMAESLADKSLIEKDKKLLEIIAERCQHLQTFVDRYSIVSKQTNLNRQDIHIDDLVDSLKNLFSSLSITLEKSIDTLWADIYLFEQVLINLIQNAQEANSTNVQLNFSAHQQHFIIEVIDDGHGFANLDNLFVPLYTTKIDGQGIGLSFCKNIIEQHQGVIELLNNEDQAGVTVMIILPSKDLANA